MAAGDSTLVATQTRTQFTAGTNGASLIGQAFDAKLDIAMGQSNILSQLQGPPDSGKPFIVRRELEAVGKDKINFTVGAALGQAGRRGLQRAVNYEEGLLHATWPVQVDNLRVVVAWNELLRWAASTGQSWQSIYPTLCGERAGQIEQEDMLVRLRQRSGALNTIRPGRATSLNTLGYGDTMDAATIGRAHALLSTYAKPATVGKMSGGMDLKGYVALGSALGMESLWNDPTFTNALSHAAIDGPTNPYWTNDLPMWRGTVMKRWDILTPDTPGAIGSSIAPQAILGDASATANGSVVGVGNVITSGTTTFDIYGGGRSQASLGDGATLYKPFEYFYGCDKLFGETISVGADANVYYFVVIDPADGKWNLYSYTGSTAFGANGYKLTITSRLHSSTSGVGYTTVKDDGFGGAGATLWTYDPQYNKVAFPIGSHVIQVGPKIAPVCDTYFFGSNAGAKCYGSVKNKPIQNTDDYGALNGKGVWSIYGQDVASDTQGLYHRGFVRLQSAYEHPLGGLLPQI